MKKPVVYAHRGASGYAIENTIPSFQLAVTMKADAVEFDVQLTSDNEIAVFHDRTLRRLFNINKKIASVNSDELKQYIFKNAGGGQLIGIPLLEDVFKAIGHRIVMNIELKAKSEDELSASAITERVLTLVKKYNLINEVIISSFDITAVRQMRKLSDNIRLALLVSEPADFNMRRTADDCHTLAFYVKEAKALRAEAINIFYPLIDTSVLVNVHNNGLKLNAFTVNNDELLGMLIKKDVDGFFTNYPDKAVAVIEREIKQNNSK